MKTIKLRVYFSAFKIILLSSSFLILFKEISFAQPATVGNPLAIGQNCGGGSNNFKSFIYDSTLKKLTQVGANCNPNLQSPGFNPGGGSIAFSPKDQKVFYIETTTGNNSIVWSWTPGVCPTGAQAPIYTYPSTFIVGLEFNTTTGDGYQLEFSTGAAPYTIYLRKVTSFGPPLVAGTPQQILLPSGKNIWQQNGDLVITPTGRMYFVLDNKMFTLDYSAYGTGSLNAQFIDTLQNGANNNVIGLSYSAGKFITSILGGSSSCSYKQVDISSGLAVSQPITLASGTFVSYDMATMTTGIGAAKRLSSVALTGVNTYQLSYDIKVKNYGNVNLTNVQLTDSIKKVFGAAFVNASVAALDPLPSRLTLNPLFNGNTDSKIFATGGTMKASPADSATVTLTVNVINPGVTTYLNTAIATATGVIFSNNVRDSSHNQNLLNPDPSGKDIPDLAGEGVPTPFNLAGYVILPTHIKSFTAKSTHNTTNLSWELDNQAKEAIIILERSADGIHFETLTKIPELTKGNWETYNWIDSRPVTGASFYRLQLISNSGSKILSNIISVKKQETGMELNVSPNPFSNLLRFNISLDMEQKVWYQLLDMASRPVISGSYLGEAGYNEFNVEGIDKIAGGNYILDVTVNNKHYYKKVLKN